jgi:hypothetical protein
MNTRNLILTIMGATALTPGASPAASLGPAVISSGAARLDNGSLVNLGQPLVVLAGAASGDYAPGLLPALNPTRPSHPPFALTPAGAWASNGFTISFTGRAGTDYVLWASTNLTLWSPIRTNRPSTAEVLFQDSSSGKFPWRFYRVSAP